MTRAAAALARTEVDTALVDVSPIPSLRSGLALAQRIGAMPGTRRAVLRHYEGGHAVLQLDGFGEQAAVLAVRRASDVAVQARVIGTVAEVAGERPLEDLTPAPVSPPLMESDLEQAARTALAGEEFGVLVMVDAERIHTSTVLFAETPNWCIVFAARAHTRKAKMAAAGMRAAFHVDTRGSITEDRQSFTRIGFDGQVYRLPRGGAKHEMYRRMYVEKLPLGKFLLTDPDIYLHLFEPATLRIAVGGRMPVDVELNRPT
jgi:hypothetical protein